MLKNICLKITLPIFLSIFFWFLLMSRSPKAFTILPGPENTIIIQRDEFNIPHIKASSMPDAVYALGYTMCQDRMWQLDIIRRVATGRLSEFFGSATVEVDKFYRNLKIRASSENDVRDFSKETLNIAKVFVQGINDAAAQESSPLEYYLTSSSWENITVVEMQSFGYFMALGLAGNWGTDVLKIELRKALGEGIENLLPKDYRYIRPESAITSNQELDESLKGPPENLKESDFQEIFNFYSELFGTELGSNSWVISGKHTKNGKPILSVDPHYRPSIPTLWYLSHMTVFKGSELHGENETKFGVNLIGTPVSYFGTTKHISWGATNLKADDIDVYAEKSINSTHYWYGEEVFEFLKFEEIIQIKGQKPLEIQYKESVHGPILENSLVGLKTSTPAYGSLSTKHLAFCWSALGHFDKAITFAHDWPTMKNFNDFRKLAKVMKIVRVSFVFASSNGDIGFQAVGKVPVRRYKGDKVLPGWVPETMWKGFIPTDKMPYVLNPEKGYIVASNNFPTGDQYKYYESIGTYPIQARADRINEIIQKKINENFKFSLSDQIEILKDELDVFARTCVPVLLSKTRTKNHQKFKEMQNWDYVMKKDSNSAAIYMKWSINLARGLLQGKVSEELIQNFLRSPQTVQNFVHYFQDYRNVTEFCDNPNTEKIENCEDLISQSFDDAVEFIGDSTWGSLHVQRLNHITFGKSDFLKRIYETTFHVGGNSNTVHNTAVDWSGTFEAIISSGMTFVYDVSGEGLWTLEPGMSANILSRHYLDMFYRYKNWELIRFRIDE